MLSTGLKHTAYLEVVEPPWNNWYSTKINLLVRQGPNKPLSTINRSRNLLPKSQQPGKTHPRRLPNLHQDGRSLWHARS